MKNRICAYLLCFVLILSLCPTFALADGTEAAAPTVLTAFSEADITVDGRISELSWLMNGKIADSGKFGAQWQKDKLFLAVDTNGADTLSVTMEEKTLTVNLADLTVSGDLTVDQLAKTDDVVELSVLLDTLGLTEPPVGTLLETVIALDDASFSGALELSGVDWFAVTNEAHTLVAPTYGTRAMGGDAVTAGQGFASIENGYRIYNLYQANATNPAKIRTYVIYNSYEMYEELIKHDDPIYVEFDFKADAMPVIDAAAARTDNSLFTNSGISFLIAEDYDAGNNSNLVRMGIYNTADGLVFTTRNADGSYSDTAMNKQVGDTFRLGLSWEMNGSLVVTVDGEAFLTQAGVETNLRWQANRCVAFNMYNMTAAASEADNTDVSITNIAMGKRVDPYLIPDAPTVVADGPSLTAFSASDITVDGKITEEGWLLNNQILDAEGQYKGKFGAQWQRDKLFLAVDTEGSSGLSFEFGEKLLAVDPATLEVTGDIPVSAVAAAGDIVELAVSFRSLDISEPGDGVTVPIVVHVDKAAFSGELQLSQVDWFMTDNEAHRMSFRTVGTRGLGSDAATPKQGYAQTADGWRLYDLYNAEGSNPANVRTYVIGNTSEYAELADRSQAIYSEFEFCAKSMPVYVPSEVTNWNNGWACYGFSWNVADAYDSSSTSNFIACGILNTVDGLQLVVMTATDGTLIFDLGKEIGDKFRLGTLWETNGNLYIYLDGVEFKVVEGAQRRYKSILGQGFGMNLIRNKTAAASDADSFDISITNIALGKSANRTPPATSPASPALIQTAYTAEAVTVDGKISDTGWLMNANLLDEISVRQGKLGAQWDEQTLYLAVDTNGAAAAEVTVNGKKIAVTMATGAVTGDVEAEAAVSGDIAEIAVSFEALGVTVYDLERRVPIKAVAGTGSYEGSLVLSGTDWFGADNEAHRLNANTKGSAKLGTDAVTNKQGYQQTDDGWRFYDLYNPGGSNPAQIRTYVIMHGQDWLDPVCDRSLGTELSFDFTAESLPVYSAGTDVGNDATYAAYGFSWILADAYDSGSYSNMISASIFNSTQGLMLAVLSNGDVPEVLPLDKEVGDTFRITCRWMANRDLIFYIDGVYFATVTNAQFNRRVTLNKGLAFNLIRNKTAAASEADDMDVHIENIALGKFENLSLLDTLTWDTIRGENETQDKVGANLTLPAALSDSILTAGSPLTWTSSNPDVIAADGTVTIPDTLGEKVVLTAELPTGACKFFELIVPGTGTEAGDVLVKEYDYDPATGAGEGKVAFRFTLDQRNSSVIRDLGEARTISVVTLKDGDSFARLAEDFLTLWVSDDNVTYTQIKDFKLLHQGEIWYLYDFAAEGRYVKIHCTHYDGEEADFTGDLETMIDAYDDALLGSGFEESTVTVTNEAETDRYDFACSFDGEAQRVLLDGEMLYHYVENGKTVVRVPYLAAGESAALTVLTGSDDCIDTANKEYVYEVVYGTREARELNQYGGNARWLTTRNDGVVVAITSVDGDKEVSFSYDNGKTFVENEVIEVAEEYIGECGGFIYDKVTGKMFFHGAVSKGFVTNDMSQSDCKIHLIASDDGGKTWYYQASVQTDRTYALSYTPGLQLSCYDGEGPNVDFVFPAGAQFNDTGAFCCVVIYTDDGGLTWQTGESVISILDSAGHEGGVSEGTIMEREDGTLVLYVRNQSATAELFAKSYSYDHGLTWQEHADVSKVYTVNTQPLFFDYNGADLLSWGGNTVLGGMSYIRTPMNVAITYDGGETFVNIQDLYVKYSFQGLTETTMHRITNQNVIQIEDDTLLLAWWNQTDNNSRKSNALMRVEDFTDYFYRTKGAYDSFEHGTVKFEGWDATGGKVTLSDEVSTEGSYSMKFNGGTAVRSIPYLQDGTVSMKLYVADSSHLSVNLQSAYSKTEGKCAPLGFSVDNYAITFFGAEAASGLTLQEGWNTVTFDLSLNAGTATVTVNGETSRIPVDTAIGNYVCYVTVMAASVIYVDEFLAEDLDTVVIPEAETEEPIPAVNIAGTTMTLGNDLALNFMVLTEKITGTGWYAEIAHGDKVTTIDQSEWVNSGDYTRISYNGLAAKQMVDEVVITIYDAKGNELASKTDSIRSYAMRMFGKSKPAFDTVLADMLNYGAAAQLQFNYKTDDLANSLMTDEQKAKATASVEMTDIRQTAEGYVGTTLELQSNILLNFFFTANYAGKTATVSYTDHYGVDHSYEVTVEASGSYGKVSVNRLVISDCSVPVTVTVDGISVTDSAESYCARVTDLALREPLMKFATSARAYFSK